MHFTDDAIVLTALPHGENGAVVRFLSFTGGLRSGYVSGARGKSRRALLHPGNRVRLDLHTKAEGQLASANLELVESRALLAFEAHSASLLSWLTELTAKCTVEAMPHPQLAYALDSFLSAMDAGLLPQQALAHLARYEMLLLEEEGFGLDLSACALGGPADDLGFISPKTGRAVSRTMANGQSWASKLLPLPPFLLHGGPATSAEIIDALALSGYFLAGHWPRNARMEAIRARAINSAVHKL